MKTILFADDNKNIREFCRQSLESAGYRVLLAGNGVEAIEIVEREPVDLAILDVNMPSASGRQAAEQIRAVSATTPIVFFTANHEACAAEERARLAVACLRKTDDLAELIDFVAGVLQRAEGPFVGGKVPGSGSQAK